MPAPVAIVDDDIPELRAITTALSKAGHETRAFADPFLFLGALEERSYVLKVLIAKVDFGQGKPNGFALARISLYRRPASKVVLIAAERFAENATRIGEFLPIPLELPRLVVTVDRLFAAASGQSDGAAG